MSKQQAVAAAAVSDIIHPRHCPCDVHVVMGWRHSVVYAVRIRNFIGIVEGFWGDGRQGGGGGGALYFAFSLVTSG